MIVQEGFLLIADISGYTEFITKTELEHAHAILEELLRVIGKQVRVPLRLVKREGDAVFYYIPGDAYPEPDRTLDHIEACYAEFQEHLRFMASNTTCPCEACRRMSQLDLKFAAHYGQFVVDGNDLTGSDVVLVHRLLKNSINGSAYALVTEACWTRIGKPGGLTVHSETYEHIGQVSCHLEDLRARYETQRESARVCVDPKSADICLEHTFAASPELLWSYACDPERRLRWQRYTSRAKLVRNKDGRAGVDGATHCSHGPIVRVSRFLDVRPFRYLTMLTRHKPSFLAPATQVTLFFEPIDDTRTTLSVRVRSERRDKVAVLGTKYLGGAILRKEYDFKRLEMAIKSDVPS